MKNKLSRSEKDALVRKLSIQLGKSKDIVFAYVFGSFAKEGKFSDIDVAVYLRREVKSPLDWEVRLEGKLQSIGHFPVDVRIINRAPLSFIYQVIKGGLLVVDKEPFLRADFEGLVLKKYLDFAYYRRQYLKEVIHAPV
ncbi:MAG: nucleotidyltransferase domain-containing protein [Candidatus Aminicenantales bacterium]